MLRLESLRRSWPGFSLDADLALGDAEIGAVLGPSGSGKSSLLRLVAGLERQDSGSVSLDGIDIGALPPERRGVGMVFQDFALFPAMTVAANIAYGPKVAGMPRADRCRLTQGLARGMGIESLLERYPASLSGGERQRVALARTLAASPRLVLLDEPLSSLDGGLRRRLRGEVAAKLREAGSAALHVTHDVEEAMAMADRIFLMREGRIEASDIPERLFEDPPSAWAAAFMDCGPVIPALSVEGPPEAPIARVPFSLFACGSASRCEASPGASSVYFPRDAGSLEPVNDDRRGVYRGESHINRFTCEVRIAYSTGRSRRVVLRPLASPQELGLEMDFPLNVDPARGEIVDLVIPRSSCRILPGSPIGELERG